MRLLRGEHRLALSGTPVENHLGELWSLFEFLNPGMLGAGQGAEAGAAGWRATRTKARASCWPRRCGRSFCAAPSSRWRASCRRRPSRPSTASWSRRSASNTTSCASTTAKRCCKRVDTAGHGRSRRCRCSKRCCGCGRRPAIPACSIPSAASDPSAKLDVLLEQLREVREEGHKALVFSQFTSLLAIVRERLDESGSRLRVSGRRDARPAGARGAHSRTTRSAGCS